MFQRHGRTVKGKRMIAPKHDLRDGTGWRPEAARFPCFTHVLTDRRLRVFS